MIYLKLFLTFLEIGAVSFGGGYGIISLIRERMLQYGWLREDELLNMIAVAESTPGPIAVNMATFVGADQAGVLGALLATLGVILPSFAVILLIASLMRNLLKYKPIEAFLGGVRPAVVGLVLATAITMLLSVLLNIKVFGSVFKPDIEGIVIFVIISAMAFLSKRIFHKPASPIMLILTAAIAGMVIL